MFRVADIEDSLRDVTEEGVWARGVEYFRHGAVRALEYSVDENYSTITASARVRGSDVYHAEVTMDVHNGEVTSVSCDCPYAEENPHCKHTVALVLTLCAQIETTYGTGEIESSATDIIQTLGLSINGTKSQKHTHPLHISPMEPFIETEKFDKNHVLILRLTNEHPQAFICNTTHIQYSDWSNMAFLSREALRALLLENSVEMTLSQRALVTYISSHDAWSQTFDMHELLTRAHESHIDLYRDSFEKKKRMYIAKADSKMPITFSLKRFDYPVYSNSPLARTHSRFELSIDTSERRTWAVGLHGCVAIHKQNIHLASLTVHTCTILKRLKETRSYYDNTISSTTCTDNEIIHINEIVSDLSLYFTCNTTITPTFVVTAYDISLPTLVVDYRANESTLSIRGAVDYGCALFDVGEEWTESAWSISAYPRRRTNAKQNPLCIAIKDMQIGYAKVHTTKEEIVFRALTEQYGFNKRRILSHHGTKKIERFLQQQWEHLLKLGWKIVFTHDTINYTTSEVRTDINADLDAMRDWLAFDLDLYCGDERVRLEDVIAFIERGDECLKTHDGRLIRVTNRADLERLVRMLERFAKNTKTGKFEGKLYNAPEVADIASNSPHYRTQFAKSFKTFMAEAQSGKPVERVKLPAAHKKLLRPYQAQGVEWMHFLRSYRFGGILADEMGLGKTIQALSHISMHKVDGESSLVIAPKTLLHNWKREAHERFPELSVVIIEGTAKERKKIIMQKPTKNAKSNSIPHLLITSYPLAQRDIEVYKARTNPFHYLLLDEAQSIKNPRTKNAHAVKAIPANYRIALTGTPLENSVEELWSVFDFLMPGFLGHHATFQKHFGKPIMEHGNVGALAQLKSKTSAFMLRRTKAEVLKELPPKIETTLDIELNDDQNVLYQEVLARTKTELFATVEKQGFKRSQIHILAALTKLRQICNHPNLVEPTGTYSSAKLDACMEIVREIAAEGRKVLIFSQFTSMLDIIAKQLREEKISFSLLTGKTNHRQELVDTFNTDATITVFLISLKAGGTGLNLTSADTVVVYDPWWNPAVENQAIDRAHRIGQKKTVNVYRLVTTGTIEEKIVALQTKKKTLFDALVQENADMFKKLTWDDVQDIFR